MADLNVNSIADLSGIARYNITLGTEQTGSGSALDFTIPSGVRRVTVLFEVVSPSTANEIIVQLGDSGGIETTGYTTEVEQFGTSASETDGFYTARGAAGTDTITGAIQLFLKDSANFTWVGIGNCNVNDARVPVMAGIKSLSAELTTIRVTCSTTGNPDAGTVAVQYEF